MTRQQLYDELYAPLRKPIGAALLIINERYSPEAGGYKEFADGGSPNARSEAEWAEVVTHPQQRELYLTWFRILHEAKSFAAGMQWVKDESCNLDRALHVSEARLVFLDHLIDLLHEKTDHLLIAQLHAAKIEVTALIEAELSLVKLA